MASPPWLCVGVSAQSHAILLAFDDIKLALAPVPFIHPCLTRDLSHSRKHFGCTDCSKHHEKHAACRINLFLEIQNFIFYILYFIFFSFFHTYSDLEITQIKFHTFPCCVGTLYMAYTAPQTKTNPFL